MSTSTLELGDIININAPTNAEINDKTFLIDYIDIDKRIDLIDGDTLNKKTLTLSSGVFDDKSINSIDLLDRSSFDGYAAQNGLILGVWIDIFFGGDIPYSITGQITDKIEDMIEIQNYENDEKLYLDFEYKGLPDDIPINTINIRGQPHSAINKDIVDQFINREQSGLNVHEQLQRSPDEEAEEGDDNNLADDDDIDDLNVQISEGDQIVYGAALEDIYYYVEVDKEEKIYSIDDQLEDLQDDILATIPSNERSYQKNLEINLILNRFKELRLKYSIDHNGILKPKFLSAKPLLDNLHDNIRWLIPVVKDDKNEAIDEEWVNAHDDLIKIYETSSESNNRYLELMQNLRSNDLFKTPDSRPENLIEMIPNVRTEVLSDNNYISETYLANQYLANGRMLSAGGDTIIPTSFIQTPILHIDYSRTSLIQTDLLTKATKPPINLWEMLSNPDNVPNIIEINNDILTRTEKSNQYYNYLTNHITLNDENASDSGRFLKIMNEIVPKTNDIIKNISVYYNKIYTVHAFIEHLHVFKIDEITKSNRLLIVKAVTANINSLSALRKSSEMEMKVLRTTKYETNYKKQTIDILLQSIKAQTAEIFKAYGYDDVANYSNSEIFNELMRQDNFYLLSIIISNLNAGLLITNNVNEIIEEHKLQLKSKFVENDKCAQYVIAKRYNSLEALEGDVGITYYDMEYDNTPYVLKDDYYTELSGLSDEAAIHFLKEKLEENLNMDAPAASNLAKIIFGGKKPIADGLYAILDTVEDDKITRVYYVRRDNNWVISDIDDASMFVSNNKDICNMQPDCVITNNGCISTESASQQVEQNFASDLMSDFNISDISLTKEALQEKFNEQYRRQIKTIVRLRDINNFKKLFYDRQQKMLGMTVEENEPVISPYSKLLDKILGQYDFSKKQDDVIRFHEKFCRTPTIDEDQNWYYCILTQVKLMPTFMKALGDAFNRNDYVSQINKICAERGGLSDDGNAWIDKHSGYKIKDIEYSEEEGYDDTGFKAISRALLEADVGDEILRDVIDTNNVRPESHNDPRNSALQNMVSNIVRTMLLHMAIEYDTSLIELDIQNTLLKLIGEEDNIATNNKVGKVIMYVTLSYLLIALQTAMPPIKSKKTFPGCIKSFTGYPYEGTSDKSGLEYICCVAMNIKSSIFPWNTLKKTKKTELVEKLQTTIIPKYLINEYKIRDMIRNKKNFMKTYKGFNDDKMPNLDKWETFLPPLSVREVTVADNISRTFENELISDIKTGKRHNDKLDLIKNKVYFASITIQNKINEIVKAQTPLMVTMANVPFIENACCQEDYKTISYFANKNGQINDGAIKSMMSIYHKYNRLSKASILYDPVDTKKVPINDFPGYSEELIYRAFIGHCKYNTQQDIPDKFKSVCMNRPENYKNTDSISNKIRSLKNNGVQYEDLQFKTLQNILNKENILDNTDPSTIKFNDKEYLEELLEQIAISDTTHQDFKIFSQNLKKLIDGKIERKRMVLYMVKINKDFEKLITVEMKKYSKHKISKGLFKTILDDEVMHHESFITSIKNAILNICNILPNMLLNKTTFEEGVLIPKHWNVSDRHSIDIKNMIERQNNIKSHFDNESLKKISYKMSTTTYLITGFVECVHNMADFDNEMKEMMLKFTLLFILKQFITITIEDMTEIKSMVKSIERVNKDEKDFMADEVEIVLPENEHDLPNLRCKLLADIISICDNEFKHTLLTYEHVINKVNKSKTAEKDNITQFLNALTIEERETENLFKNNKLEKWSVGLQKGLRIYDKETYDRETEQQTEEDRTQLEIDADIDIHMVDDDDHGENDGDEEY